MKTNLCHDLFSVTDPDLQRFKLITRSGSELIVRKRIRLEVFFFKINLSIVQYLNAQRLVFYFKFFNIFMFKIKNKSFFKFIFLS